MAKRYLIKKLSLGSRLGKSPSTAIAAVIVVCLGVTAFMLTSHASTPTSATEAENGTVSSAANVISDTSASNGNAVKFGEVSALRTLNCTPAPADTMTNTISHLCGFPDTTNTGIEDGVTLTPTTGTIRAQTDGQTIQNLFITNGLIEVQAKNVTIKNVKILANGGTSTWGIRVQSEADGGTTTIDHVQIYGADSTTNAVQYAIYNQSDATVSVTHSNIYNCSDCIQGEDLAVSGNYIHEVNGPAGAHRDGIQCFSNDGCGMDVTDNTIFSPDGGAVVAVRSDFGDPTSATISGNLFAGGGYTVYGGDDTKKNGNTGTNIHIENNHFSRMYNPDCGQFGPLAYFDPNATGNIWSGNIWDDTGDPVSD